MDLHPVITGFLLAIIFAAFLIVGFVSSRARVGVSVCSQIGRDRRQHRRARRPASGTSSRPRSSHTSIQIRVSMGRPAAALARPLVRGGSVGRGI